MNGLYLALVQMSLTCLGSTLGAGLLAPSAGSRPQLDQIVPTPFPKWHSSLCSAICECFRLYVLSTLTTTAMLNFYHSDGRAEVS